MKRGLFICVCVCVCVCVPACLSVHVTILTYAGLTYDWWTTPEGKMWRSSWSLLPKNETSHKGKPHYVRGVCASICHLQVRVTLILTPPNVWYKPITWRVSMFFRFIGAQSNRSKCLTWIVTPSPEPHLLWSLFVFLFPGESRTRTRVPFHNNHFKFHQHKYELNAPYMFAYRNRLIAFTDFKTYIK